MPKRTYHLCHGPDRSHDRLNTQTFDRLRDAEQAIPSLPWDCCWVLLRLGANDKWKPYDVTEIKRGGPDVRKQREHERFARMCELSDKYPNLTGLALWGYNPQRAQRRWRKHKDNNVVAERRRGNYKFQSVIHWMDYLVPELAKAICAAMGFDGYVLSGPCGLRSEVEICFIQEGRKVRLVDVCNPDLATGRLRVKDYSKASDEYRPGTIGFANGLNYESLEIDPLTWSAEDVLRYGTEFDEKPE